MMAAVAYATEFGRVSDHKPAYKAKWLYSLASNRNDSALQFITKWPYIEVPDRTIVRGISKAFTDQLEAFTGIIINKPKTNRDVYKYTVDFNVDSKKRISLSTQQQFFLTFFVMRLCYTKAAGLIAKYNKDEPKGSEPNESFIGNQKKHYGNIEDIFDAFYHGAVAEDNKKALPVHADIRRYFRENLALPRNNENEGNMRIELIRNLTVLVPECVISSTNRAMYLMITSINVVLGSIKSKKNNEKEEASVAAQKKVAVSIKESGEASGAEHASEDLPKKTSSRKHGKAKKSSEKQDAQKDASEEEESHDVVNIALVGVDETTKRVLTDEGIIANGWYNNLPENTNASDVGGPIDTVIVRLRAKKKKDIKKAIESYIEWQRESKSAIFVDQGSGNVWKAIEGTFYDPRYKKYSLFYATIRSGNSNVNLYWFSGAHDDVESASEWIISKLYIDSGLIKWQKYQEAGEEDYEGYYDDGSEAGYDSASPSLVKQGKSGTKDKDENAGRQHVQFTHDDDSVEPEAKKKTVNVLTVEAKEGPINLSDPSDPIKTAIKQVVVNKGTDDSRYETIRDHTIDIEKIKDDASLIFVVLPDTSKVAKLDEKKKQEDIDAYLNKFLEWQGNKKGRLAVFVTSNGEPEEQYFIEYAKEKSGNVFVFNNDDKGNNVAMYCIMEGATVKHDYVDATKWNKVVSDEQDDFDDSGIQTSYEAEDTDVDVLVVGAQNTGVTHQLFRSDKSYRAKAHEARGGVYDSKVVVMVGCTGAGKDSISNEVEAVLVVCSNPEQWKRDLDCLKKLCNSNKENKYVFWIGRSDKKVVLLAKKGSDHEPNGFKKEAGGLGLSYDKWGLVSEISFIDETKNTQSLVLLNESKDKEEYKYKVQIPPPSAEVVRVRRSGIQCAVDYVTATKSGTDCAMAVLRSAAMTDIQRLVYLTLDNEAPVRIFALATGSGKTRCIGLALYSTIVQNGKGEPVCMIMKKGTAPLHLVNEIMTGMYVNERSNGTTKKSFIAEHISTENRNILSVFGGSIYGYKDYDDGGDSLEDQQNMENGSFEKVCKALSSEPNSVYVVFLEDLDSGDPTKKIEIDNILSTCKVVIADECNNVLRYMSKMTKCVNFIGFSATPFQEEREIEELMNWSNERKKMKQVTEEVYDEFIKNNVVYVSEDDVRSILPYAERQFDILYANLGVNATKGVYYDMTIEIEKETQETTDGRTSVKNTRETLTFKDRKAPFAEDEFEAAMNKVLETLLENRKRGVYRSLVIIPSSYAYANRFMEKVEARKDLVAIKATDPEWENKYHTALKEPTHNIVLADFKSDKNGHSASSGFPAKVRDVIFNEVNDDDEETNPGKHNSLLAMVTYEWDAVEYHGVSNTYIINTPLDKYICEQARNRAYRMCSHDRETDKKDPKPKAQKEKGQKEKDPKPKTHKIWYVVVRRPFADGTEATRGAYAIANAHPAPDKKDARATTLLSGAVRFQYDKKNTTKVFGEIATSSWFRNQSQDVQNLCNADRAAAYMRSLKEGDFSKLHDGAVTVLDLAAHLDSTALSIQTHDVRIETMIKVISAGKTSTGTAVKFDNGECPVPFHHALRGICFDRLDKEPDKYEKGDLVLRYTTKQDADQTQTVVTNISELATGYVIKDAQASYQVCVGVKKAFYVGAHRVQCTGHARFECFRVFGPDEAVVKRSFVGTEAQFNAFIETLASGDNHRGICRHDDKSTTRVTPMMVAAWIRRSLFRRRSVTVRYNEENERHKELKEYLRRELLIGEWKDGLVTFKNDTSLQTEIEITVDGAIKVVYPPTTILARLSKQSTQKQKGALYIFDKEDDFNKAKTLWVLPPADKFPTVNIRGMNPFKTMIGDKHCVRCDTATYVVSEARDSASIERVVTNDGTIGLIDTYVEPTKASSSKVTPDQTQHDPGKD
jgi:hypothetical protein